jgi:hypothetical protein
MIEKCLRSQVCFKTVVSSPKFTLTLEYIPNAERTQKPLADADWRRPSFVRRRPTQDIATHFGLSLYTILNRLKAAYKKLGVSERSQVVVRAVQLGIATIPLSAKRKPRSAARIRSSTLAPDQIDAKGSECFADKPSKPS